MKWICFLNVSTRSANSKSLDLHDQLPACFPYVSFSAKAQNKYNNSVLTAVIKLSISSWKGL